MGQCLQTQPGGCNSYRLTPHACTQSLLHRHLPSLHPPQPQKLQAFTIYNLARCPDKAAKLCAEIDATPTGASLDQLPYTDAVLHESLRLFPPIPLTSRAAARDQLIGGT